MIELPEQYGYNNPSSLELSEKLTLALGNKSYCKYIQRGVNKAFCFNILYKDSEVNRYLFETSYFVGVDWIVENEIPIYVKPKLDDGEKEVNYVKMLFDVMKEPENYNHLNELCEIDFDKPHISIAQQQDLLTPLLLIQYINILKKIVQKGLRKSYYTVTQNLNARIKGKILINQSIQKNHFNNKLLYNYCKYTEFGVNSTENKILKKALEFAVSAMQNLKGLEMSSLQGMTDYISPAFHFVDSDVSLEELKTTRLNKLYREYELALKFAKYILKRYGYNISKANSTEVKTPPFWIDMSKLFELYVFGKLRALFPKHKEVLYHQKFNKLEPDFLLKSKDGLYKMVIDAKYKPRYENNNVSTEDVRQITGYARLKAVYDYLEIEYDKVIDCLVIYSSQQANRTDLTERNFNLQEEKAYTKFYKIGIELPIK